LVYTIRYSNRVYHGHNIFECGQLNLTHVTKNKKKHKEEQN